MIKVEVTNIEGPTLPPAPKVVEPKLKTIKWENIPLGGFFTSSGSYCVRQKITETHYLLYQPHETSVTPRDWIEGSNLFLLESRDIQIEGNTIKLSPSFKPPTLPVEPPPTPPTPVDPRLTTFGNLDLGAVFRSSCGQLAMKVSPSQTLWLQGNGQHGLSGLPWYSSDKVTRLGTIVISSNR